MSTRLILICCLGLLAISMSCKKSNNNSNNNTACNGKNLCMKIDGTLLSENAKWMIVTNGGRRRILWEAGSGATYQNIELDIYDTVVTNGNFPVSATPGAGQAAFQYFTATPAKNIQGMSGTVSLSSTTNNTLTGTFTITAKDQNNVTVQITEGNFVNVPK